MIENERKLFQQVSNENKKLKQDNETLKMNFVSKLAPIMETIGELKIENNKLKVETEDNYQGFQDVWPHLLNIYEYQSKTLFLIFCD